ncbi:protein phosphatase [Thermosporothrix hazakensis]|jgi:protein phosphatase|uniref:Protein phosphatase n=1 Tax=Thermosporothrix hazakensis TaxID=644383 RepID=A0A326U554_THEHA|nr:AAA family ATPase [Thermosporothrix hazakensis]PZW26638.1 protein phosphatase [Thermosporothrix hazakensis]GCE47660.1 hypothetical protein KTH_25290 [Thermosporothrix hazakensis]
MDRADSPQEKRVPLFITIPERSLVVLCGPAGAGKSTFAHSLIQRYKHRKFAPTMIVSSDYCRALVSDDETNQFVSKDAFDIFHYIIRKRMYQNRFTIADSTALSTEARYNLLDLAAKYHYHTCLLIFDVPLDVCLEHEEQRHRRVGSEVISYHQEQLRKAIEDSQREPWKQVHVLHEEHLTLNSNLIRIRILPPPPPLAEPQQEKSTSGENTRG